MSQTPFMTHHRVITGTGGELEITVNRIWSLFEVRTMMGPASVTLTDERDLMEAVHYAGENPGMVVPVPHVQGGALELIYEPFMLLALADVCIADQPPEPLHPYDVNVECLDVQRASPEDAGWLGLRARGTLLIRVNDGPRSPREGETRWDARWKELCLHDEALLRLCAYSSSAGE